MARIKRGELTFIINGEGMQTTVLVKTNLQTFKLVWANPQLPQRTRLMQVASLIRKGKVKDWDSLFHILEQKIILLDVSTWH
ncbi:hypothetical protein EOL73_04525 [Candidatus Saccharibacteria bacterium]|nr:hypothetical protein [Candidatus Saccharibacteria bacterium]